MSQFLKLDDQQLVAQALSLCAYGFSPNPILKISAAWARITGYKAEKKPLAEKSQSGGAQQIHASDHTRTTTLFNKLYSGDLKQTNGCFQIKNKQKKGCEVEVFVSVIRHSNQGRAQHVV